MAGYRLDRAGTRAALAIFRVSLHAYPRRFRARYGEPMMQVFRDRLREPRRGAGWLAFWLATGADLASTALVERSETMRPSWTMGVAALALALGLLIGIVDSRPNWNDSGISAGALVLASGLCGVLRPAHPWRWALAVGLWLPALNIAISHNPTSVIAVAFAFLGAYAGAFARRALSGLAAAG